MNTNQSFSDNEEGEIICVLNSMYSYPDTPMSKSKQQNSFDEESEDNLFDKIRVKFLTIVEVYRDLLSHDEMNDAQADLLERILRLSVDYPILSELLSKVDENLSTDIPDSPLVPTAKQPFLCDLLSTMDKDISLENNLSQEFRKYAKQAIGNEEYQAWDTRLR
jgi:hypothetical protein